MTYLSFAKDLLEIIQFDELVTLSLFGELLIVAQLDISHRQNALHWVLRRFFRCWLGSSLTGCLVEWRNSQWQRVQFEISPLKTHA